MAVNVECVSKATSTVMVGSLEVGDYFSRRNSDGLRLVIDKNGAKVTYICIIGEGPTIPYKIGAATKVFPVTDVDIRWSL